MHFINEQKNCGIGHSEIKKTKKMRKMEKKKKNQRKRRKKRSLINLFGIQRHDKF
jgi:hypothetical protein